MYTPVNIKPLFAIAALLSGLLASPASATEGSIKVHNPWIPEAPPVTKVHAAYMSLENSSNHEITLSGFSSSTFKKIEIHQIKSNQGMMKMMPLKELKIPANSRIEFRPGGFHFMLTGSNQPLRAEDKIDLTLIDSTGSKTTFLVPVKNSQDLSGVAHSKHHH